MQKRDLKLDEYNISKNQYRELRYFCLQYREKKQRAAQLLGLHGYSGDGQPAAAKISNVTAKQAELREQDLHDCQLIEQTALLVDPDWHRQIILGVTEDRTWNNLRLAKGLKMNEREYNQKRRRFYYELAKKKHMI